MTTVREEMNSIREDIHQWLSIVSEDIGGYPVTMADRSDPRPDPPYFVFKLLTGLVKIGAIDEQLPRTNVDGNPNNDKPYRIRGRRNLTVSIEAVGRAADDPENWIAATDMLEAVRQSLDKPSIQGFFRAKNLSVRQDTLIGDTSVQLDTETEPRAVLDLVVGVCLEYTDDPGYIDTVKFSGDFDSDGDGAFDDISIPETTVEND